MRGLRRAGGAGVDEENPYWISFSDILSALLAIFILAAVILILQLMERQREFDQEVAELKKAEQVRREILEEAAMLLRQRDIVVEISENHSVLRIPNEVLSFRTGAFEIDPGYARTARDIGEVLDRVISPPDRLQYLDTIFVEGHTDARPFQGFMGKGNWGLSAFRAISLWQFWSEELPQDQQLDRLRNRDDKPLFSVSGYAETRAISSGVGDDEHSRDRRIDIRITIRRPDSEDFEGVGSILRGRD